MTNKQMRTIESLKRRAMNDLFFGDKSKYEFKQFNAKELEFGGKISVTIETGLIGDEGTLASVYAREWCHIFVGPRGGITYYTRKGRTSKTLKGSLLTAVIEQR